MKSAFEARMFTTALTRWLYPARCAMCQGGLCLTEEHLCRKCFFKLHQIRMPVCSRCSIELPPYVKTGELCSRCRSTSIAYDEGVSLFRYDENFKNLLHQIKYDRKYWLIEIFAKKLKREIKQRWNALPSYVIPVPLDKNRLKERTFNQSLIVAQLISKMLGVPVMDKAIVRRENRPPQSWLSRKERLQNLEGLFEIKKPRDIKDQWVILVDDVVTTGTTVQECALTLKAAGAARVTVFSLARTPQLS